MKNNLIKKIFKQILGGIYRKIVRPIMKRIMGRMSASIPKFDLRSEHIKNAKLLKNRDELLKLLPQNGIVAELGVDNGDFSDLILNINKPKRLHLIDSWGSERFNQTKREKVENRFASQIKENLVIIDIELSTQVVHKFKDNYFDWIYIDTSHSYEMTIAELEFYRTKVKENGIIAGHDYILGNWDGVVRYGVIEAVHEFCLKYDWEILYITVELKNTPSFAIRKIISDDNTA